jgi:hypothetical protein
MNPARDFNFDHWVKYVLCFWAGMQLGPVISHHRFIMAAVTIFAIAAVIPILAGWLGGVWHAR